MTFLRRLSVVVGFLSALGLLAIVATAMGRG